MNIQFIKIPVSNQLNQPEVSIEIQLFALLNIQLSFHLGFDNEEKHLKLIYSDSVRIIFNMVVTEIQIQGPCRALCVSLAVQFHTVVPLWKTFAHAFERLIHHFPAMLWLLLL